jgi:hypothetical protein
MGYKDPPPSAWVFLRLALALAIAGVLGYRWHQGVLTWPLILMSAFVSGLLVLEMFTAGRRGAQGEVDAEGNPVPRRPAADNESVEVDAQGASEDRVRTSPGVRR